MRGLKKRCRDSAQSGASKMSAQLTKTLENQKLSCSTFELGFFELPCSMVRNENGIQACVKRRIDVAARAIADHPAVRFYDFELLDHAVVGGGLFFEHNFNCIEIRLQAGALHFCSLLGRFTFCEQ